jgi:hypothetical protein
MHSSIPLDYSGTSIGQHTSRSRPPPMRGSIHPSGISSFSETLRSVPNGCWAGEAATTASRKGTAREDVDENIREKDKSQCPVCRCVVERARHPFSASFGMISSIRINYFNIYLFTVSTYVRLFKFRMASEYKLRLSRREPRSRGSSYGMGLTIGNSIL